MSVADTNTRILPPAELTEKALASLNPDATALVRAALSSQRSEESRPVRELYRGRHRTAEPVEPKPEPWNRDPEWFPAERTREISPAVRQQVVEVPLPKRSPGAAAAALDEETRHARVTAAVMRAAQRLRGVLGVGQ